MKQRSKKKPKKLPVGGVHPIVESRPSPVSKQLMTNLTMDLWTYLLFFLNGKDLGKLLQSGKDVHCYLWSNLLHSLVLRSKRIFNPDKIKPVDFFCHAKIVTTLFVRRSYYLDDTLATQIFTHPKLTTLTCLKIESNPLMASLEHLSCLRMTVLNLGGCFRISHQGLAHLTSLTKLATLCIPNCHRLDHHVKLRAFPQLRSLDISGTNKLKEHQTSKLKNLVDLCAGLNNQGIEHMTQLMSLSFSINHETFPLKIKDLTRLTRLVGLSEEGGYLGPANSKVNDKVLESITHLTGLQELRLKSTSQITSDGLVHLKKLPVLKHFECRAGRMKELDIFCTLPSLRTLLITESEFDSQAIQKLVRKCPGVTVDIRTTCLVSFGRIPSLSL
jgi:hypothetical protein